MAVWVVWCVRSEKGERKLDVLLAMMGIPKHVAKQKFSHMPSDYKKLLNARIAEYADKFGLTEVTYGSFQKFDGYRYRVSAADVVYSANALLEAGGEGPEKEMSAGDITLANFWNAYQALAGSASLSGQFVDKLQAGINRAIKLQQLVLMQGKIIIDKNHVSDCGRNFQWITVAETVDQVGAVRRYTAYSSYALQPRQTPPEASCGGEDLHACLEEAGSGWCAGDGSCDRVTAVPTSSHPSSSCIMMHHHHHCRRSSPSRSGCRSWRCSCRRPCAPRRRRAAGRGPGRWWSRR
jgi:hypothetical protein